MGVDYVNILIAIAKDRPVDEPIVPRGNDAKPTIASE